MGLTEYFKCTRKIRFRSSKKAENAKKDMKKHGKYIRDLDIYKCPLCQGYHLGHKPKTKYRIFKLLNK